jgi:hypothetical protein
MAHMSEECVHIDDMELAKFFHDLFLSFMDFAIGIVPRSRIKKVTRYLQGSMYHFIDFKLLGLIEYNNPTATLKKCCRFLEANELAEKVNYESEETRFGTSWSINVVNCVFGNSCKGLHSERFICPAALFAGFLIQEAGPGRVRMDTSRLTLLGCETEIELWDEVIKSESISIKG